jgi:hypothetical protein
MTLARPALVKALARAFRYQRLLDEGRYASISEMAAAESIERGYVGTLMRLTLLAPDIVEAILNGRELDGVALPRLLEPLPCEWVEQCGAAAALQRRAHHAESDAPNRGQSTTMDRRQPAAIPSRSTATRRPSISISKRRSPIATVTSP